MNENQSKRVCIYCGDRVNDLENHYLEIHRNQGTRVCPYCGDSVNNLEKHHLDLHKDRVLLGWAVEVVRTIWGYKGEVVRVVMGWGVIMGIVFLALWLSTVL